MKGALLVPLLLIASGCSQSSDQTNVAATAPSPSSPGTSQLDHQIETLQIDVPRLREIANLVATSDDQPSKQVHDEFWGLILTRIQAEPKRIEASLNEGMNKGLVLQIAFWESLLLSAQSERVVLTDEFARLRDSYPKGEITSDYAKGQNEILNAAATGEPFLLRDGRPAYVTVEIAEQRLAGMNAMRARFKKLHNPDWNY